MPKEYSRARRVAELVRRELADIMLTRISDPRLGLITITAVDVSKDLKHAKVFITQLEQDETVQKILNKASRFLNKELCSRLSMKVCPQLRFEYDHSVERGTVLSKLIESVNKNP